MKTSIWSAARCKSFRHLKEQGFCQDHSIAAKVVDLWKQFPFEKGWGTASQLNIRFNSLNPELTTHSFRHGITDLGRSNHVDPAHIEGCLATGFDQSDVQYLGARI